MPEENEPVEIYQATQGQRNPACYLTPREEEVLQLISEGFDNPYISERLTVGTKSIENYIHAIYSKLGVNRSTEYHSRVGATLMWQDAMGRGAAFFLKPRSGSRVNFPGDHPLSVIADV